MNIDTGAANRQFNFMANRSNVASVVDPLSLSIKAAQVFLLISSCLLYLLIG